MAGSDDFDLWLGRIGSDTPTVGKTLARARRAGGHGSGSGRRFTGARLGRGNGVGRVLGRGASGGGAGARRVVVKSRIVKLGKGMAAATHLRYLQRDGTTRDGERGSLYGSGADRVDGKPFLERSAGDRHQFRFIVAPEDGAQSDDLKPVVRRLMEQAEKDLGTKLDWVDVDHFTQDIPTVMSSCGAGRDRQGPGYRPGLYDPGPSHPGDRDRLPRPWPPDPAGDRRQCSKGG